jgi:hypothetical protein
VTADDLETRLRETLRAETLPVAPRSLRQALADLPALELKRGGHHRNGLVLFAAALILVGLGAGAFIGAAAPSPTIPPTPAIPAGYVPFEAPGIRFAHPRDWQPSTAHETYPDVLGMRVVGLFERGLTICPYTEGVAPAPTERQGGCATEASAAGSLIVQIVEFERQLPTAGGHGTPTTFAGYPGWIGPESGSEPAALARWVSGPDDGLYFFWASVSREDLESVQAELDATLQTLRLSSWHEAADVSDGRVHVETNQGFSFDYPAGWAVYYPQHASTMDHAVATVASRPLDPCPNEACQRFTTPAGTVALEFRVGRGPSEPDWTKATETIGGQPASIQHWGSGMVTGADEGHHWNVRLDADRNVLGIYASLRGPGLEAQREMMNEILSSVRIDAPPPGDH